MANAKSLSYAESGEERIEHIGRIGHTYGLAKLFSRRADTICK